MQKDSFTEVIFSKLIDCDTVRYDRGKEVIAVLVALTKQDEFFYLSRDMSHHDLQQLKQVNQFYCPQCKEPLLLKVGAIKIPHFAHLKHSYCDSLFSEGESTAHLTGKQQLFSLFSKLQLSVILEPYLPHIQQRPDLLVTKGDKQYAIEFQCSKIATSLFERRTNGYFAEKIHPIWILHTPNETFKSPGLSKLSINHTNAQFIQTYKNQRYLITYDVQCEMFYYVSNLIPIQGLQYFGVVQAMPLWQQQFPFYIPQRMTKEMFQQLFSKLISNRNVSLHSRLLLSRRGVNDIFLRAVYELHCTVQTLPHFIGIPISLSRLEIPNAEWQLLFFYFLKSHHLTPQSMHEKSIPYFLQWTQLPENAQINEAVCHYLQLLKKLAIENIQSDISDEQLIEELYFKLVAFG